MLKGRSFLVIIVTIAICAIVLRVAASRIIKISISQNESNASVTLKIISTALENYARDNKGVYPVSLSVLNQSPPYLNRNYSLFSSIRGYNYGCSRLEPSGYSCSALPVKCKVTGNTAYTVTTGGVFIPEPCGKK